MYMDLKKKKLEFIPSYLGLVWKIVNTWSKNFYDIPFQKLVFLIPLYPEIFRKRSKEIKQNWFLVDSCCFCFAFHPKLMPDGKKKRFNFFFILFSINFIDKHANYFVSVNSIADKNSVIFCFKDNMVM